MRKKWGHLPVWMLGLVCALLLGIGGSLIQSSGPLWAQAESGFTYTVRAGDSWLRVATRLGVDEAALRAANPDKVRENDWLIEGEQLVIPLSEDASQRHHEVQVGESWNSIASRYNISVGLLQAANPRSVRAGLMLYRGERLVVPPPPGTPVPTADTDTDTETETETDAAADTAPLTGTATVTATVTSTVTPPVTSTVTATPTATATAPATAIATATTITTATTPVTATESVTPTAAPSTATPVPEPEADTDTEPEVADLPECPARFLDYPQAMTAAINTAPAQGPATLRAFLESCEALVEGGFVTQDLTGNEVDDVVVIYRNPSTESIFVESDLAIFNGQADGYTLAYRARAAGDVYLLAADDMNQDEQMDIAWVDTTCGASTCFDTVNIRSWTGTAWADWTEGTITMAYAGISLVDADELELDQPTGTDETTAPAGQAIILVGGIYGSVGAGPQRSREEIWASVDGAPYSLITREFMASECLYHVVIDANAAFINGWEDDFAAAEELYNLAAGENDLLKCWVRPDEEDELRSFSLFRLALIAGYRGEVEEAAARAQTVIETYPNEPYEAVAAIWLREYRAAGSATDSSTDSAAQACEIVTQFAELTPETWEILADYGYTNPGFEAADVCPILTPPDPEPNEDAAENGDADSQSSDEVEQADENAGAPSGALASFPDCPADLTGYASAVEIVLAFAGGDEDLIEAWLVGCRAMSETRGAFLLTDITGNGARDAVVFPVLVTDLGFGPGGAQGTALIYHIDPDGGYTLIAQPEIYGQPQPLAVADLNGNGQIEVAWTVTGCSTFCVTEVQMWSWDGSEYVSAILPGATMANAQISFEPVTPGAANGIAGTENNTENNTENETLLDTDGPLRLVLYGGVSGTPDGGLDTPHWEEWQSFEGNPYERVRWEYERTVTGSECLGLRLIEADVALQAAPRIGYAPALELYANALADLAADELAACSIMGMEPETELDLLHGLATFRLLQVYALSGDLESAGQLLADFQSDDPATGYAEVADAWWEIFAPAAQDDAATAAVLACAQVLPLIDDAPELWQVTDQYGYNHPVLAAEQICYTPDSE